MIDGGQGRPQVDPAIDLARLAVLQIARVLHSVMTDVDPAHRTGLQATTALHGETRDVVHVQGRCLVVVATVVVLVRLTARQNVKVPHGVMPDVDRGRGQVG